MCRMVAYSGHCTRCAAPQTWDDLTQHLSCLEAKNWGVFGECSSGVSVDHHGFDQECDRCAEEDEGVYDVEDGGRGGASGSGSGKGKGSGSGGHRREGSKDDKKRDKKKQKKKK